MLNCSSDRQPLSSPQREIWFDQLLHDDLPLYNIGGRILIPGPIDPNLLNQAATLLVQQHDALRIVLSEDEDADGVPLQSFVEPFQVEIPIQDFSNRVAPQSTAMDWMQARFVERFNLVGQPLFRLDLVKLSDQLWYLLVQYHHLITDGWGVALLNRSLADLYNRLAKGPPPPFCLVLPIATSLPRINPTLDPRCARKTANTG